jgi:BirA family biotin operon repressor/biotin-[acetyl-CoA-carboxylase] ligase
MFEFKIIHLQQVDSTNTYLKKLSSGSDIEEGTVIMADHQTDGRGQGKNTWLSEPAANITMSILVQPMIPAERFFFLNEFVSLAIIDLLEYYNLQAFIKWPNDIYADNKKVAGILIENILQGRTISVSIAGIGLNVNQLTFPPDLPNPVSIALLRDKTTDRFEVRDKLLECFKKRYVQLGLKEFQYMHKEYNDFLYKKGEKLSLIHHDKRKSGELIMVNEEGELVIKNADGSNSKYFHGEVQFLQS